MIFGVLIFFIELIPVFVSTKDIWVSSASLMEEGSGKWNVNFQVGSVNLDYLVFLYYFCKGWR